MSLSEVLVILSIHKTGYINKMGKGKNYVKYVSAVQNEVSRI